MDSIVSATKLNHHDVQVFSWTNCVLVSTTIDLHQPNNLWTAKQCSAQRNMQRFVTCSSLKQVLSHSPSDNLSEPIQSVGIYYIHTLHPTYCKGVYLFNERIYMIHFCCQHSDDFEITLKKCIKVRHNKDSWRKFQIAENVERLSNREWFISKSMLILPQFIFKTSINIQYKPCTLQLRFNAHFIFALKNETIFVFGNNFNGIHLFH